MTWTKYGPVTGTGYQALSVATNGLFRLHFESLDGASIFGGTTTPQRWGQTGWIAPYDEVSVGDGIDVAGKYIGPLHWSQTEFDEIDWVEFNTNIAGITGFAYGVMDGNSLSVYAFTP
jgi:hypothetical protein